MLFLSNLFALRLGHFDAIVYLNMRSMLRLKS